MPKHKRPLRKYAFSMLALGLVLIGVSLLFTAWIFLSSSNVAALDPASPEVQFNRALADGKPIFAFFHSTDCQSCVIMMDVVDKVFPAYDGKIALVDVIVSEQRNRPLMELYAIRAIPTLMFFNANGQAQTIVGALEPQDFQDRLESIVKR